MNKKHKNGCAVKNYIQRLLILAFAFTRSVSISALASLVAIIIGIMSSTVWRKICAITAGIQKYKSIIKKSRRNMIK